jgi:predicted ATPase
MNDSPIFRFADFTLHVVRRELSRQGKLIELGSRAMDVLLALVRRHGQVATKSDIMNEVWPGVVVEENNLTTQIAAVRRALGETEGRRFIQTVPGRGYRFVADMGETAQAATPASEPVTERHNLPLESSSFIGRDAALKDLRERLENRALVTLVGPGGMGKTRVALRLAETMLEAFRDGVFLLELAPLTEGRLVAEAACRMLGVPATGEHPAEAIAISVLRTKQMLLVLDNCEHVLDGAAAFASAILRHCPTTKILVTSREALGVSGESVLLLPPLPVPRAQGRLTAAAAMQCDAVRLFVERAADALGSYRLTDADAPAVATICRRLDGMPLATELAAARLRMLKPAEIAARLENVFRLLTGGSRVALPRHQTLRAAIDWSFSLLSSAEQTALRRLAVFVGGCSLDGAMAVAGGGGIDADMLFDLLSALVAKSLVVADTTGDTTRYRMLETTRQYATEKLKEAAEYESCWDKMSGYLLEVFRQAERAWPQQDTDSWLAAYSPEAENLRAAIDYAFGSGHPEIGVALVAHAGAITEEMSLLADLRRWTETASPHVTPETPKAEAAAVLYLGSALQKRLGSHEVPVERQQAIALFRADGNALGLSRALRQTAIARAMPGEPEPEILAMLEEAVALLRKLAPHKDLATALAHTGGVHFLYGEHEQARRYNEAALAMREALGDRSGMLASTINLAEALFLDGDVMGALRYARQAEAEARSRNALASLALILSNMAGYELHGGDAAAARQPAMEALGLSRAIGQDYLAVMCLEHLALGLALEGAPEPAARILGFTGAHYASSGQTREWLEQAGYERLLDCLRESMPAGQLAWLLEEGAALRPEAADAAALRAAAPSAMPSAA